MARPSEVLALTEKANRVLAAQQQATKRADPEQTFKQAAVLFSLVEQLLASEQGRQMTKAIAAARRARRHAQEAHRILAERQTRPCEGRRHHQRGRAPRLRSNHRVRGSARSTRAGPSSSDDPPGESDSEPPRLRLWRHPRFGSCTPNLLRVLVVGVGR